MLHSLTMNSARKLEENVTFTYDQKSSIEGEFQIKFDGSFIDESMNAAFADLQKRVKEKGFRPGKVPLTLVKKKYHQDVYHDVYNRLVYDSFVAAVRKENVRTAGEPEIVTANYDNWKQGDQVEFTAKVDLIPDVELKKYKKLSVKKREDKVKDEDIEKTVSGLLDQRAELVEVTGRAIKEGDFAVVDFVGSSNGEVLEDAKAQNFLLEIVDNKSMPEFKEGLIGEKAGAEKTIEVDYPEDFSNKNIAGKKVSYAVKVHEIKEKKLPELTDEIAKEFGTEGVDDLKSKIRENLEMELEREQKGEAHNQAVEKLIKANDFEIPGSLKGRQLQVIYRDVTQLLQQQRFTQDLIDEYIRRHHAELEERAEKEVKLALLLAKLIEAEKIEATEDDLKQRYETMGKQMQTKAEDIEGFYKKNPDKLDPLKDQIVREKALDFIVANAK